ncbi:hypothetical protein KQX54_018681 [Cotesia glomerata]|uniref:Uncharacterized protein n=1 Tax=Cotesia glomerata TaxID=32391 RepID=A0AAV7IFA1_COTGL|nr:hypothetical protein KQX54_018681 [Cotesia glomerata]
METKRKPLTGPGYSQGRLQGFFPYYPQVLSSELWDAIRSYLSTGEAMRAITPTLIIPDTKLKGSKTKYYKVLQ